MSFELPPELWLYIFEESSLDHLPQIQSVCRLFRNVSRPLLFSEVKFIIGERDEADTESLGSSNLDDLDSEILHPQQDFRREFEKLEFWTSETISPHVRSCDIRVLYSVPIEWDSPLSILSACFKAISQFTNLRILLWDAESIQISSLRADALPSLKRIDITSPGFVRPSSPIPNKLQLTHFSYTENSMYAISEPSPDAPLYLSFLDPTSLRSLRLKHNTIPSILLQRNRILMSSFQNLRTLELHCWNATTFTQLHAYLSPFPAIQDLTLGVWGMCTADALPDTALAPQLRRYSGPSQLLPLILRHAAPTDIMLHDDGPHLLQPLLDSDAEARGYIPSLELWADYSEVSDSTLALILSLFPRLTAVTVNISLGKRRTEEGTYPATRSPTEVLFKPLRRALRAPQALTTAVLNWWSDCGPNEVVPDLEQLKAALLSGVPSLVDVSFGGD
ncbi:hypothetical protein B0H11DRAFT_2423482 [Mycena galericulata]|nr:hypothetical protein B0H11DRAFT_2423482 [Mycena galericulata]